MKRTGIRETFCGVKLVVAALFVAGVFATSLIAAEDEAREWVDSTGKHKITATLVSQTKDKVKLRREDGRIIDMPIDRLSAKDRAFLNGDSENPFEAGLIEESKDEDSEDEKSKDEESKVEEVVEELSDVDFSATTEGYRISGRRVPIQGFWDRVYVGGYERAANFTIARSGEKWTYRPKKLSTARKNFVPSFSLRGNPAFRGSPIFSRYGIVFDVVRPNAMYIGLPSFNSDGGESYIARCDLKKGDVALASVPYPEATLCDVSPDGNYALSTVRLTVGSFPKCCFLLITPLGDLGSKDELGASTLFSPNYREDIASQGLNATASIAEIRDARWIDSKRILTKSTDGVVTAWDLANGRAVYSRQVGDDAVILDPDRKVYITANESFVCAYNIQDGKSLGRVNLKEPAGNEGTEKTSSASAATSPDGLKLAVVSHHSVTIVDMEKGEKLISFPINAKSHHDVVWGSDDYLIVNQIGYDLKSGLPICKYDGVMGGIGNMTSAFGQTWALTRDMTLLSFDAPHDAARNIMKDIKPETYFDVYPGCPIAIKYDLNGFNDQKEVEKIMQRKFEIYGFKLDPKSKTTLVVSCVDSGERESTTITEVETTKERYAPERRRVTDSKKVDLIVYEQSVSIEKNGLTLWSDDYTTTGSNDAWRDEKKTMEQQIKEMNMPDLKFFSFLGFKQFILKSDPMDGEAVITATLTSSGIE